MVEGILWDLAHFFPLFVKLQKSANVFVVFEYDNPDNDREDNQDQSFVDVNAGGTHLHI